MTEHATRQVDAGQSARVRGNERAAQTSPASDIDNIQAADWSQTRCGQRCSDQLGGLVMKLRKLGFEG